MVTIYRDIYSKTAADAYYITIDAALARISDGKSKARTEALRATADEEKQASMKKLHPSVCFSGKFTDREDDKLVEHSGFLIMDFDEVEDISELMATMAGQDFVYAAWLSPRGNG